MGYYILFPFLSHTNKELFWFSLLSLDFPKIKTFKLNVQFDMTWRYFPFPLCRHLVTADWFMIGCHAAVTFKLFYYRGHHRELFWDHSFPDVSFCFSSSMRTEPFSNLSHWSFRQVQICFLLISRFSATHGKFISDTRSGAGGCEQLFCSQRGKRSFKATVLHSFMD